MGLRTYDYVVVSFSAELVATGSDQGHARPSAGRECYSLAMDEERITNLCKRNCTNSYLHSSTVPDHPLHLLQQHLALPSQLPLTVRSSRPRLRHRPAELLTLRDLHASLSLRLFSRSPPLLCFGFALLRFFVLSLERRGFGFPLALPSLISVRLGRLCMRLYKCLSIWMRCCARLVCFALGFDEGRLRNGFSLVGEIALLAFDFGVVFFDLCFLNKRFLDLLVCSLSVKADVV